ASASDTPASAHDALKELQGLEPQLAPDDWRSSSAEQVRPLARFHHDEATDREPPEFNEPIEEAGQPLPHSYGRLIWICVVLVVLVGSGVLVYSQSDSISNALRGMTAALQSSPPPQQQDTGPRKTTDRIGQPDAGQQAAPKSQRAMLTTEP